MTSARSASVFALMARKLHPVSAGVRVADDSAGLTDIRRLSNYANENQDGTVTTFAIPARLRGWPPVISLIYASNLSRICNDEPGFDETTRREEKPTKRTSEQERRGIWHNRCSLIPTNYAIIFTAPPVSLIRYLSQYVRNCCVRKWTILLFYNNF